MPPPVWAAVIVQEPIAENVAELPVTVQIVGVEEE
jgi:hypothetical protein